MPTRDLSRMGMTFRCAVRETSECERSYWSVPAGQLIGLHPVGESKLYVREVKELQACPDGGVARGSAVKSGSRTACVGQRA